MFSPSYRHEAKPQRVATGIRQLPEPLEVARVDRGCRLDFDSDEFCRFVFEDKIHLVLVFIAIVRERDLLIEPGTLFQNF